MISAVKNDGTVIHNSTLFKLETQHLLLVTLPASYTLSIFSTRDGHMVHIDLPHSKLTKEPMSSGVTDSLHSIDWRVHPEVS